MEIGFLNVLLSLGMKMRGSSSIVDKYDEELVAKS